MTIRSKQFITFCTILYFFLYGKATAQYLTGGSRVTGDANSYLSQLITETNQFIKEKRYSDAILNLSLILEIDPTQVELGSKIERLTGLQNNTKQSDLIEEYKRLAAQPKLIEEIKPLIENGLAKVNEATKTANTEMKINLSVSAASEFKAAYDIIPQSELLKLAFKEALNLVDKSLKPLIARADTFYKFGGCAESLPIYKNILNKNPFSESDSYKHANKMSKLCTK